ncbi:hypothetical protein TRFO_34644 [Tritrichomonas foetus]|uniref:Importin N-terminal domain-containing protein n=1 Tax=Tritrichomonas foetus TaxID=1144522 RepID=A0A1J4JK67_9EUKA|nr:hypothetical protein TRFO_34644 [Tritrichomonas foetus]|eukprot:OHS98993.1 hypothetical protein TRFO_34644 [Tritrichomonas foetus]
MDQENFVKFVQALECTYNSDNNIRDQATAHILNFQAQNPLLFLQTLFNVLKNEEIPINIKNVALVLSYKTLKEFKLPDLTVSAYSFFQENSPGLLNSFLTVSTALFSVSPNHAGQLFSYVTILFCEVDSESTIIPKLLEGMNSIENLPFIEASFIALDQIAQEIELPPFCYLPLLHKIFTLFGSNAIPNSIKVLSLKIVKSLIGMIPEVFENEQNCTTILNLIKFAIMNEETKVVGFGCVIELIKYHFDIFLKVANEFVGAALAVLSEFETCDEELILVLERLIKVLYKRDSPIIMATAPKAFECFIKIALDHGKDEPNLPEEYSPHTVAYDLISRIIKLMPSLIFEHAFAFAKSNINSPNANFLELASTLYAYLAQYCDEQALPQMIPEIVQTIKVNLAHPSPRVREAILFLIDKCCNRQQIFEATQTFLYSLIPQIVLMLNDLPVICLTVCLILPKLSKTNESFTFILDSLFKFAAARERSCIFVCMREVFKGFQNNPLRREFLPRVIELARLAISDPNYLHNQYDILNFCESVFLTHGQFDPPVLYPLIESLFGCFAEKQNLAAVYCLAALAATNHDKFDNYFNPFMQLVFQLCNMSYNNENIFASTYCLLLLEDYFDLSDYAPHACEIMINVMQSRTNDLVIYDQFLPILMKFFKRYERANDYLVPCVRLIAVPIEKLQDIVDENEKDQFINQSIHFFIDLYLTYENEADQWRKLAYQLFEGVTAELNSEFEDFDIEDPDMELIADNEEIVGLLAQFLTILFERNPEDTHAYIAQSQQAQRFISLFQMFSSVPSLSPDVKTQILPLCQILSQMSS